MRNDKLEAYGSSGLAQIGYVCFCCLCVCYCGCFVLVFV